MSMYEGDAQSKVSGPATGLMVTGILGIVVQALGLLLNVLGMGLAASQGAQAGGTTAEQNQLQAMFSGTVGIIQAIIGIVIGVVIILGAMKMKRLESYGFAMASAILAMIPCVSPCCLLGLPIGIWAAVVINKPEVKSSFH